ncbi:MAG: YqjD family protein [Halomonas sp.]
MANRAPRTQESTQQLKEDLHQLSQTIEELVSATADDSRGNIKELRDRAEKRLKETRERLESRGERLYGEARETLDHQVDACDRYVHDNPWTSIGIGAVVGVVVGMLIGRR